MFQALRDRGLGFERIDARQVIFNLDGVTPKEALAPPSVPPTGREAETGPTSTWTKGATMEDYDVVLMRCVSYSRALYAAKILQEQGVRTVNSYEVIATCGDKILTTLALVEHGVPTPRAAIAFARETALAAAEEMGYPAVLKPPVGSWGRLIAKLNDREAAEAVIEHREFINKAHHVPFYVQGYVHKPGRDIRTLVVGDETVYAVYRNSPHWITNTARGGNTSNLPITPGDEIDLLSRAAAKAVGGGIIAVDIMEAPDGSLLVNEVNHSPEFHGAMQATDADITGKMIDYVLSVAREAR